MEKIEIEIPVSAGNKVYRTNNRCAIEEGIIEAVRAEAKSYLTGDLVRTVCPIKDNIRMSIHVQWKGYRDTNGYNIEDIGTEVFTSKESLIKHLVGKL